LQDSAEKVFHQFGQYPTAKYAEQPNLQWYKPSDFKYSVLNKEEIAIAKNIAQECKTLTTPTDEPKGENNHYRFHVIQYNLLLLYSYLYVTKCHLMFSK
jgi:hypothetical protein